ncbi:FAD-dependent monooxygenase [Priestia sp. GS2]|uniref:FAD-dependent monooxygenase n=1 Tax=Priestia sp. GS2 TaxID=3117403 RepID=UPI002EDB1867
MKPQVLIVGAGPTGLALARSLANHGVQIRIIEKNSGPGTASRALVVHARILEHYQQLGFSDRLVNKGLPMTALTIREGDKDKAKLNFPDLGEGLSPFPYILSFPQDEHEEILVDELKKVGIEVEWNTELTSFSDNGDTVKATLKKDGCLEERTEFNYLCGCDGAHSTVRKGLGIEFPGGTYDQLFFVADVESEAGGAGMENMYMYMDDEGFISYMPVRNEKMKRIIGIVPKELTNYSNMEYKDISSYIERKIGLKTTKVNWFSTYRVHHRVSEQFIKGRIFIAGDAGHIHSPAGGQGMNTGIGDAINLSWKLAAVIKGKADSSILETYESERIAFARILTSTTDKVFQTIVGRHVRGSLLRKVFMPYVVPFLFGFSTAKKKAFKVVSQTEINYRDSKLSNGTAGKIVAGERLPWIETAHSDNFKPLQSFDWQIHIYGQANKDLIEFAQSHSLKVHEFTWEQKMDSVGFQQDALYLIRPDGYVALANKDQNVSALNEYLTKFKIAPFNLN